MPKKDEPAGVAVTPTDDESASRPSHAEDSNVADAARIPSWPEDVENIQPRHWVHADRHAIDRDTDRVLREVLAHAGNEAAQREVIRDVVQERHWQHARGEMWTHEAKCQRLSVIETEAERDDARAIAIDVHMGAECREMYEVAMAWAEHDERRASRPEIERLRSALVRKMLELAMAKRERDKANAERDELRDENTKLKRALARLIKMKKVRV